MKASHTCAANVQSFCMASWVAGKPVEGFLLPSVPVACWVKSRIRLFLKELLKSAQIHIANSEHNGTQQISRTYSSFMTETTPTDHQLPTSFLPLNWQPPFWVCCCCCCFYKSGHFNYHLLTHGIRQHCVHLTAVSWGRISYELTSPPKKGDPSKNTTEN